MFNHDFKDFTDFMDFKDLKFMKIFFLLILFGALVGMLLRFRLGQNETSGLINKPKGASAASNTTTPIAVIPSTSTPIVAVPRSSTTSNPPSVPKAVKNTSEVKAPATSPVPDTVKSFWGFNGSGILEEAGSINDSSNTSWWLNSGGLFYVIGPVAGTIQGNLGADSRWYDLYLENNPRDTDSGLHPQNIFRLVNRNKYLNFRQEMYFKIVKDNLSNSEYRNESNGILFFNRYADGDNLYYAGIRVDGYAVVKKKIGGKYFDMALQKVFPGPLYNRGSNPTLLPKNYFIGIRTEVKNAGDKVNIKVFLDTKGDGSWKQYISVDDANGKYSGRVFDTAEHAGIRTDFMDVEFKDYKVTEL